MCSFNIESLSKMSECEDGAMDDGDGGRRYRLPLYAARAGGDDARRGTCFGDRTAGCGLSPISSAEFPAPAPGTRPARPTGGAAAPRKRATVRSRPPQPASAGRRCLRPQVPPGPEPIRGSTDAGPSRRTASPNIDRSNTHA